jgi:hypothetical protein
MLPVVLWPRAIAAEVTAFVFLFRDSTHVTAVDVVNRSVGGSFVACGLIAWQLRRDSRIGYWLPRFDSYVDAQGRPVVLPQEGSGRATTFVDHDGHHVAALLHDAALAHQPDLLQVVCAAANVALERERLQTELCASSHAASTPQCSSTAWPPRWTRWPRARPSRPRSSSRPPSASPSRVELAAYFVASEALEGRLRVSSPAGAGTVVTAELPCEA